jgi:hypothetical protein
MSCEELQGQTVECRHDGSLYLRERLGACPHTSSVRISERVVVCHGFRNNLDVSDHVVFIVVYVQASTVERGRWLGRSHVHRTWMSSGQVPRSDLTSSL